MNNENSICIIKIGLCAFFILGVYTYTLKSDIQHLQKDVSRLEKEVLNLRYGKNKV